VRTAATILAIMAAGLGIIAAGIAGGDRGTLVPPPDAVAEAFARELAAGRYDLARSHLSDALKASTSSTALRLWFEPVRRRLGAANRVDAEIDWMQERTAAAQASLDAEHGTAVLPLRLVWEHGLWGIDDLPSDVPIGIRSRARGGGLP
jgi:hypothetical protein